VIHHAAIRGLVIEAAVVVLRDYDRTA